MVSHVVLAAFLPNEWRWHRMKDSRRRARGRVVTQPTVAPPLLVSRGGRGREVLEIERPVRLREQEVPEAADVHDPRGGLRGPCGSERRQEQLRQVKVTDVVHSELLLEAVLGEAEGGRHDAWGRNAASGALLLQEQRGKGMKNVLLLPCRRLPLTGTW